MHHVKKLAIAHFLLLNIGVATADDKLVELSQKVGASVVHLQTDGGTGSGFVIDEKRVVTNYHVVENASQLAVKFRGGAYALATGVLHLDEEKDIAIIQVDTRSELMRPISVGTELPKQGQDVAAYGNPKGFEFSVTRGIVSGIRSAEEINSILPGASLSGTWIQTDAAISGGNSGGPLVAFDGSVVGMNTWCRTESQNLNFAISCSDIQLAIRASKTAELKKFDELWKDDGDNSAPGADEASASRAAKELVAALRQKVLQGLESALTDLPLKQLKEVEGGQFSSAFPITAPVELKESTIARVQCRATVIQVLEDGVLMELNDVRCFVWLLGRDGAELRAKFGNKVIPNVPIDSVFWVGKAQSYETVAGTTAYYINLIPAAGVITSEEVATIAGKAIERYQEQRREKLEAAKVAELERRVAKLRYNFSDATGKFKVDAVAVRMNDRAVTLIRLDNKKIIDVPLSLLSNGSRKWIRDNATWIKVLGDDLFTPEFSPRYQEYIDSK